MTPTKQHAEKILELLTYGLVKGLGEPEPGKMCVEAVVCYALGLPHSDKPLCVGSAVRDYKIRLNDCALWLDNHHRAQGMKELAIAQLGSNELDQELFKRLMFQETQEKLIPLTFDWIPIAKRLPDHDELKQFCIHTTDKIALRDKFDEYNNYYYNQYHHHYRYYYHFKYNIYRWLQREQIDILLSIAAKVGVDVLKEMNCKGCEWLDLIPNTKLT